MSSIQHKFVDGCMSDSNVREVRRMISEDVDINGVDKDSHTGLMWAMMACSNRVVRILLGCNNIKIDKLRLKLCQAQM